MTCTFYKKSLGYHFHDCSINLKTILNSYFSLTNKIGLMKNYPYLTSRGNKRELVELSSINEPAH